MRSIEISVDRLDFSMLTEGLFVWLVVVVSTLGETSNWFLLSFSALELSTGCTVVVAAFCSSPLIFETVKSMGIELSETTSAIEPPRTAPCVV